MQQGNAGRDKAPQSVADAGEVFSFDPIKNLAGEFQTLVFQKYI